MNLFKGIAVKNSLVVNFLVSFLLLTQSLERRVVKGSAILAS